MKRRPLRLRGLRLNKAARTALVPAAATRAAAPASPVALSQSIIPGLGSTKGPKAADYGGVLEYLEMIRKHPRAIFVSVVIFALLAFLTTLSSPRIYQAHTTVEIQGMNDNFLNMQELSPTLNPSYYPEIDIQTQISILTSDSLISRVRDKMTPPAEALPLPDRLSAWKKALGIATPSQKDLWNEALGMAAGGVHAAGSKSTRIVEITCNSTSPVLAASFLNVLTEEFIEQNLEARWQGTEHTGEWLTNQLRDLKVKLEKSQDELQRYAASTGIFITTDEKNNVNEAKLADLQKELFAAQADRVEKQSRWETAETSAPEALAAVMDDSSLQDAQSNLEGLRRTRVQLGVTYTPNAPQVKEVDAQIAELNGALERQRQAIRQRIQTDYEAAARREKLLQDSYEQQAHLVSGESVEMDRYNFLKREVDATRTLYESLLTKMKESSIASALRASNIRVVDRAKVPGGPYQPNAPRTTTTGAMIGLLMGVVYSVWRERADRTLQDPGDTPFYLKVPELGVIPICGYEEAIMGRARDSAGDLAQGDQLETSSWTSKTSLVAESVRTVLLSILYSGNDMERQRTLVVTSSSPKEGKTTLCCNLAIAMAEVQSSVVLIDGDMRRPRLHEVFRIEKEHGLSDLLSEMEPLTWERVEPFLRPSGIPGLRILTCGSVCGRVATILHSPRLGELLDILRTKFRSVLIDTPPMVNIADARIFGRYSDGVVLVVRSYSTTRHSAQMARERLEEDKTNVIGTILNAWDPNVPGYSHYRDYYSGYFHYYGDRSSEPKGRRPRKRIA